MIDFTLTAIPQNASAARRYIRSFLESLSLEEWEVMDILTATGEAVINSIEHAYRDGATGMIHVQGGCNHNQLVIAVADQGRWKEPVGGNDERGRGFPIMRKLAQSVDVMPTLGGTVVELRFPLIRERQNLLQQAS